MGAATSSEATGDCESVKTPPQPQRQLNFDPRSPSVGIERTPILVPATPVEEAVTPARDKLNKLFDPRSPAENFLRTPLLTPVKFDFSELEQALKSTPNKVAQPSPVAEANVDEIRVDTKQVTNVEVKQVTPPSTPSSNNNNRLLSTTPLAVRSPNVSSKMAPGDVRGQHSVKEGAEYSPLKTAIGGRSNLRQMAHHQNHVRGKGKRQRRIATIQDENSPRTMIRL